MPETRLSENKSFEGLKDEISFLRDELSSLKELNEEEIKRFNRLERSLYGDEEREGLYGQVRVLKSQLKLFWMALAAIGTTSLTLLGHLIANYFSKH